MSTPLATLILSGGRSSRMGRPKALLPWRESTVLEHLVALYARHWPVWVAIHQDLADPVGRLTIPARTLVMADWQPGLFATVQPAIRRLRHKAEAFFITPVDCLLPDATVPRILAGVAEELPEPPVLVPHFQGRPGHPVLVRGAALDAIADASPDRRLDHLLAELAPVPVPVDDRAILHNINTEVAYQQLLDFDARARRTT